VFVMSFSSVTACGDCECFDCERQELLRRVEFFHRRRKRSLLITKLVMH